MSLRRIELRVATERLDAALDLVLALLPHGVHQIDEGETTRLIALGEPHQLTRADALAEACGDLLVEPPTDEPAGDLHTEIDRLRPAFRIADRVLVRPPGAAGPSPDEGLIDVVISRTSGFGTGAHPTTRIVIELLLDLAPGGAFLDIGCGAGVLVATAGKLGWGPVSGVDFSEKAVEEARANAERNGVEATVGLVNLLEDPELPPARLAVANVSEVAVQQRLAPRDWGELETLVVSGLRLGRDAEPVLALYEQHGFAESARRVYGNWVAVQFDHVGR